MSADAETEVKGSGLLLNQPIVIDNGTSTIKAGFAGGSKPKVVIGTKIGRAKHLRIMPGGALEEETTSSSSGEKVQTHTPTSIFVGNKLDEHRGAFLLEYPMDKGYVTEGGWGAMERLWEHVYAKNNLNAKMDEHPVLLTESPLNPKCNRNQMAEIFFETYRAPAVFFTPPSVLSLYASGRTTGVVLDVGEGVTHAVPVYEGFALQHSVTRSDIAGRDVTKQLQLLLRRNTSNPNLNYFSTTAEFDFIKQLKEDVCYVTPTSSLYYDDSTAGAAGGAGASGTQSGSGVSPSTPGAANTGEGSSGNLEKDSMTQYQLPDGTPVTLSKERYLAPNVLFDPFLVGSEELSVTDVLVNSIMKSDLDLRSKLFSQIVLAGGTSCLNGFGDRLLYETRNKSPIHTRIRISVPPERVYSTYVGGSILASLATFKNMWVSRADYEEHGANILHKSSAW